MTKRVLIIGNGMASTRVAAEIAKKKPDSSIVILGEEPHHAYDRTMLTEVLSGEVSEDQIDLAEPPRNTAVHKNVRALRIDRARRIVQDSRGTEHPYDALVIATGGTPRIPAVPGLPDSPGDLPRGVCVFSTLDDCRRILGLLAPGARAVVLGGGLLGLEAARALVARGADVEVLHRDDVVMNRQLNRRASDLLIDKLAALGVTVRTRQSLRGVRTHDGAVRAVELDDGQSVTCDLLVLACGFEANTQLAAQAGLRTAQGVVVDARMRTSDPAIHAVGDCAEHEGTVSGLVGEAWRQADTAAASIAGEPPADPGQAPPTATRLKTAGIALTVMGESSAADGPHVHEVEDRAARSYRRIVLRNGRLVGALVLGGRQTDAAPFLEQFRSGAHLTRDTALRLLHLQDTPEQHSGEAAVCYCNNVPQRTILQAWAEGASTVAAIARRTKATTGCGICRTTIEALLHTAEAERHQSAPA
ncbi:FAD-dependent oxidoreductase [Streptomyces sp. NPDC047123]|uniref:FAD-dependent oxidoreductase n=1 Tax=Streptomyces sp. NPDC047123 TaxID=3155622 RepID=UPI0033E83DFB